MEMSFYYKIGKNDFLLCNLVFFWFLDFGKMYSLRVFWVLLYIMLSKSNQFERNYFDINPFQKDEENKVLYNSDIKYEENWYSGRLFESIENNQNCKY
jgi:hypothetical protein